MDFVVTDLLSATFSPASDGTVRATRSASFSGPAVRKSFSSVLQGVGGAEKKGNTHEADSPRGSYKVEDRPDPKQSKGLNTAASQTERPEAPQARTSDGEKANDGQDQTADRSREESESAMPQSNSGSADEGQVFVSMTVASALQPGDQMRCSEVQEAHNCSGGSDCGCGSAEASSSAPVMTAASIRPTENRPLEKGTTSLPLDVQEPAKDTSLFQKGAESHVKQSTELGVSESESEVKGTATDSVKTQAAIQAALSGETTSSADQNVTRKVQSQEGKVLQESQLDRNLVAPDRSENGAAPPSTDNQSHILVSDHDAQGDRGARSQGLIPQGQQLVADQERPFSQSGHDHDGRQQGNPEARVLQGTAVDLQSMNGRTTEHYAAVAQNQTMPVPPAPSSPVAVPSGQPAHPIADVAQQPTVSMWRSVVLDVVQPDLGHVNIRVAMMNDSVHAHFSTDRAEIGQFLINGQDRLQTTLQANGLDMGQFRVDIDRQNGGRSFHQGLFQEQGQSGHQGSQGVAKEQAQGWSDDRHRPLQGRLNLVA